MTVTTVFETARSTEIYSDSPDLARSGLFVLSGLLLFWAV
jgi:hypothetical protein